MIRSLGSLVVVLLAFGVVCARAAVDFEKQVAPILQASCAPCHGERAALGNVALHTREAMTKNTSLGPLVTPGDPAKSALYTTLIMMRPNPKAMPPSAPLEDEQKEIIRQWIVEGAKWPEGLVVGAKKASAGFKDDLALVEAIHPRIVAEAKVSTPEEMTAYTEKIPATEVTLDFVPIPGGSFRMGSPDAEKFRKSDEGPAHRVQVDPFWMGKVEVTWDAYRLFMFSQQANEDENPDSMVDAVSRPTPPYVEMSFGMGLNGFPAISMTQHAANKFAQWLSMKTGHLYRLPTEAEWEYACRAGSEAAYSFGDDPAQLGDYAWYADNAGGKYQPVGAKKPNKWGLYDMHGNVMEWTLDQYSETYYAEGGEPALNPWNKATDPYPHAVRGGSWADPAGQLRCSARMASDPSWKSQDPQLPKSIWYHTDAQWLGFRLVRPLKVPSAEQMFAYWNSGVEYD